MPQHVNEKDLLKWTEARVAIQREMTAKGITLNKLREISGLPNTTVYGMFRDNATDVRFNTLQVVLAAIGWDLARLSRELKVSNKKGKP